jgi:hypothetical protein
MPSRVSVQLPPFKNAATVLAVLLVVASVMWKVALDAGVTLYLVPAQVLAGEVWQLVTWLPAEAPNTGSVLFGALIVWTSGGMLERLWGRARFLRFILGTIFLSGLLTLGTAMVIPFSSIFFGGMVMSSAAWVGQGCAMWDRQMNLFGYPISGRTFAMIGVLFTALNAAFSSPFLLIADIWGVLLTFAYAKFGLPGSAWTRFRSWQLERDLKKRSANLKVLSGDRRNMPGDSDKFLH